VHRLDIRNAIMLNQGQKVTFDVIFDERKGKPRAENLRVVL
jgi:cold shock CspA family protein